MTRSTLLVLDNFEQLAGRRSRIGDLDAVRSESVVTARGAAGLWRTGVPGSCADDDAEAKLSPFRRLALPSIDYLYSALRQSSRIFV